MLITMGLLILAGNTWYVPSLFFLLIYLRTHYIPLQLPGLPALDIVHHTLDSTT